MKNVVILLLTLGVTVGAAKADTIIFSGDIYDITISSPVAVGDGSESLLAFTLTAINTTGDAGLDPSAFDGLNFGYTGITGMLHQHYSMIFDPPPLATATLDSAYATAIDTHFLFPLAAMLIVTAPSEDVFLAPSLEATDAAVPFDGFADTDFGAQLTGVFAVTAAPVLDLAYVVVPAHSGHSFWSPVKLDFYLSGTKGGEYIYDIPEPATLALLSMGGVALLRRKHGSVG